MYITTKPIMAFDMDDTLFPFVPYVLDRYNNTYNDNLKYEDITDYNVSKFIKPECKDIWGEFVDENLFLTIKPFDGVFDTIERLESDYEILFPTAGYPPTILWRDAWLRRHYRNYNSDQLVRLRNKQLLNGNIYGLADDGIHNLIDGDYRRFMISKPWNALHSSWYFEKNEIVVLQSVNDILRYL